MPELLEVFLVIILAAIILIVLIFVFRLFFKRHTCAPRKPRVDYDYENPCKKYFYNGHEIVITSGLVEHKLFINRVLVDSQKHAMTLMGPRWFVLDKVIVRLKGYVEADEIVLVEIYGSIPRRIVASINGVELEESTT